MASGRRALVLTALLLMASYAAAQTPPAREFGAPRTVVPMPKMSPVVRCRAEFAKLLEVADVGGIRSRDAGART
jgi:hypothetical protein